jgi:hypothetical protein
MSESEKPTQVVPLRQVRYVFGRLNVIATYDNKHDFLLKGLHTGKVINVRDFGWGLAEISQLKDAQYGSFLTGLLVKYRPETKEEVFDPKTHKLGDEEIDNKVNREGAASTRHGPPAIPIAPLQWRSSCGKVRRAICR